MNHRMERAREFGAALLRWALGAYYLMHAYFAGAVIGIPALIEFNAKVYKVPFPEASAWFIVIGHFVGGLMLVIGLYPRVGALLNIPIMAGAVLFVHAKQGFFMKGIILDASKGSAAAGGYEYALFLLIATAAVVLLGGGLFTLGSSRRSNPISLR